MNKPPEIELTPPKGKVVIGNTYLDSWGRKHRINGHVVKETGWHGETVLEKDKVWALSGHHFFKDGRRVWGGSPLIVTDDPKVELTYWKARLAQILRSNSPDKLRLISEGLDNMEQRIAELEAT